MHQPGKADAAAAKCINYMLLLTHSLSKRYKWDCAKMDKRRVAQIIKIKYTLPIVKHIGEKANEAAAIEEKILLLTGFVFAFYFLLHIFPVK